MNKKEEKRVKGIRLKYFSSFFPGRLHSWLPDRNN